jgi:hypothetical protein
VELLTGDLVLGVLLAVLALAVGSSGLGNVDLRRLVSAHSAWSWKCFLSAFESIGQYATQPSDGLESSEGGGVHRAAEANVVFTNIPVMSLTASKYW